MCIRDRYQTVHDALAKNGSSYQVLATKVNNAVKLSIEKYISEYNKDHAKAKTLEDVYKRQAEAARHALLSDGVVEDGGVAQGLRQAVGLVVEGLGRELGTLIR